MFCTQATMVCSFKRITLDLSHEQFNIFTPLAATGGKGKKTFHKGGKAFVDIYTSVSDPGPFVRIGHLFLSLDPGRQKVRIRIHEKALLSWKYKFKKKY